MRQRVVPLARAGTSAEWNPVTWKKGRGSNWTRGAEGGCGGGAPRRTAARAARKPVLTRLVARLRCVPTAPFARPVVPEV